MRSDSVQMSIEEKQQLLRSIFWDYHLTGKELLDVVTGVAQEGLIARENILLRMLERLGWHDIVEIVGVKSLKELLTPALIIRIRQSELRIRYEFIRSVLSGATLSFTGWGDEYYQGIKHTLFSHRWYSTQQTLL
jgi:hypothetical protein